MTANPYGIANPVQSETVSLNDFKQPGGGGGSAPSTGAGSLEPMARINDATEDTIASAKTPDSLDIAGQAKSALEGARQGVKALGESPTLGSVIGGVVKGASAGAILNPQGQEAARRKMLAAVLAEHLDTAEANSVGSMRHGVMFGDGSVASSTADTRGFIA